MKWFGFICLLLSSSAWAEINEGLHDDWGDWGLENQGSFVEEVELNQDTHEFDVGLEGEDEQLLNMLDQSSLGDELDEAYEDEGFDEGATEVIEEGDEEIEYDEFTEEPLDSDFEEEYTGEEDFATEFEEDVVFEEVEFEEELELEGEIEEEVYIDPINEELPLDEQ